MAKTKLIHLAVMVAGLAAPVQAGPFDLFASLFDTLITGDYQAAHDLCRQVAVENPDHPVGLYARATVLYTAMVDFEDTLGRAEFLDLTDSCSNQCKSLIEQDLNPEWELRFLRGSALSARALTAAREGDKMAAVRLFMKAKDDFSNCIKIRPDFADAYAGRGAYRYAVAQNAGVLSALPLIPSRNDALGDLWKAVRLSSFSKFQTLSAMVWFFIDDRQIELADSVCTIGLQRFPLARSFLWPLLSLRRKQERWNEVERVAETLLQQYQALPRCNGYDVIGLYLTLSQAADHLGKPKEARAYALDGCREAMDLICQDSLQPFTREKRLAKIRQLEARARLE